MSYSWFRRGTCTVNTGSSRVDFQNADITTAPSKPVIGDAFTIDNSDLYEAIFIGSDSTGEYIMLDRNFEQASASSVKYAFMRLASSTQNAKLVAQAASAINQKQISLDDMYEWYTTTADEVDFEGPDGVAITVVSYHKLSLDITTVSGNVSEIDVVATNIADIKKASDNIDDIKSVGANIDSVKAVSTDMASIKDVESNMADVKNVSVGIADVRKVSADIDKVETVSTDIASVKAAATDIDAIKAAPAAATKAENEATKAEAKATEADASAKAAAASAGIAAGSNLLMTEQESRAIHKQNEQKFAAIGMVSTGKHGVAYVSEGLWVDGSTPNTVMLGGGDKGTSDTKETLLHIAGSVVNITNKNWELPPAEDGKRTYNNSTGESITHSDVATAFALASSNPDVEVVTHRVDLILPEYYEEELTGRLEVMEDIHSTATTFGDTDVPTVLSTRPLSYFQQYDGQFPDPDLQNDRYRCVVWSDLTDEQKRKVAAYMGEKLFMGNAGKIKNGRLWATTIRGLGNGDWHNINSNNGNLEFKSGVPVLSRNGHAYVQDATRKGVFTDGHGCFAYVVATVPRANQGAHVEGVNEYGTALCSDGKKWYESANKPATLEQCFIGQVGGDIASGKSGHPDGIFYDGIKDGGLNGIIDWRKSAYTMSSREEGSKGLSKLDDGTYRGLEKLVRAQALLSTTDSSTTNRFVQLDESIRPPLVAIGDTVWVKGDGVNDYSKRTITSIASTAIGLNEDTSKDVRAMLVFESKVNLSVSGELSTQMVICDPVNFLKVFPNGILGTWCPVIPDGVVNLFPVSRKYMGNGSRLYTTDNGATWSSQSGVSPDGTTNKISYNVASNGIYALNYKAFASQTKPTVKKKALNATDGLMGIVATQSHDKAVLSEAVAGIILKSDASGIVTEQSQPVKYLVDGVIERIKTLQGEMVAPTNNSQAVKIAVYQISENGEVSLGIIANTMSHNGTSWGELEEMYIPSTASETFTDSNGTKQQAMSTELAISLGWSDNHARFGTQVPGVDL